ncbi:MAG: alpha-amylase family glycosyl hydrolase, partial [Burkholderiaceae bacterium]
MKRRRALPFGAMVEHDGVRFRLWAPAARSVDLVIDDTHQPMSRADDGFFEIVSQSARAGTRYRYRIDGELQVPDPASRFNADDVDGPSVVVDADAFNWPDAEWRGRPWEEAVIYELHVGTFTPQGTFAGVIERLPALAALGVTAIELMPVADFPGRRGWGYDGVLWYAPDSAYGTPDDLKRLVAAAHAHGLMIFLDVVYNHFGPQGNFLARYAPSFFTERHLTPWGAAIDYSQRQVREFAIENAMYWLEEFHFDGLRLDAVHAIADDSTPHFLHELAKRVAEGPGAARHVHL